MKSKQIDYMKIRADCKNNSVLQRKPKNLIFPSTGRNAVANRAIGQVQFHGELYFFFFVHRCRTDFDNMDIYLIFLPLTTPCCILILAQLLITVCELQNVSGLILDRHLSRTQRSDQNVGLCCTISFNVFVTGRERERRTKPQIMPQRWWDAI